MQIKEVRVYIDNKDLGTVTYGTTRTDVNKAYPGYISGDNAGFEGIVDISSVSAGNKKLTIKVIKSTKNLYLCSEYCILYSKNKCGNCLNCKRCGK